MERVRWPQIILILKRKASLEHNLVVADLPVLDMPAGLHHLEPVQISQRLTGTLDGRLDRILDAGLRRTDEFDHLVDMI